MMGNSLKYLVEKCGHLSIKTYVSKVSHDSLLFGLLMKPYYDAAEDTEEDFITILRYAEFLR